jgi:hypothetical protein
MMKYTIKSRKKLPIRRIDSGNSRYGFFDKVCGGGDQNKIVGIRG